VISGLADILAGSLVLGVLGGLGTARLRWWQDVLALTAVGVGLEGLGWFVHWVPNSSVCVAAVFPACDWSYALNTLVETTTAAAILGAVPLAAGVAIGRGVVAVIVRLRLA
jgi:hypothetical protein